MAKAKSVKKGSLPPGRREFAAALVQLRKARGFESAYQFYHQNKGKKLSISYHYYLLIEQGVRLPSLDCLRAILDALGGKLFNIQDRTEILVSYLRATVEDDAYFTPILDRLKKPVASDASARVAPKPSAEEELLTNSARQKVAAIPQMSEEQTDAMFASPLHFWVTQWLLQTGLERKLEHLCADLGATIESVRPVIDSLVSAKLLKRRKEGSVFSPFSATDLAEPSSKLGKSRRAWLYEQIQARIQPQKPNAYGYYLFPVESDETMSYIVQIFRNALRKAYLYRPQPPVTSGALTAIEYRISPLIDIKE